MADTEAYLEALPDAVVVVEADGTVAWANVAAERLAGTRREELAGKALDGVLPLLDGAGNPWWACSERLRRMPGVRGVPPRELTLAAGGRAAPVDLSATFVRGADTSVVQAVCVLRDASARRRTDANRGELISTLAHELRSPLTSVKGFTSTLLHRWDRFGDEQKRHMLTTINADADRVTRLIGELLDVSRIEAGRLELQRQMIEVPLIARDVVGRFELQSDRHAFRLAFPPGFPEVYADRDKVEQVLVNLVENAVKYSKGGTVTVRGEVADDAVEVAVADEGVGIPADQLPLIFTKFYRRGGHGAPTGTGLGLFITRGLVEAHGGRIWARSEVGRGTEVRFRLPRGGLELAGIAP
ncbi:MAG TPA: ATP-binding protein [Actinomycetota bacterium]|nr:ATP-binding protein [Actinomycetota bacterium]